MLSFFFVLLHPLLADGVLNRGRDDGGVVIPNIVTITYFQQVR